MREIFNQLVARLKRPTKVKLTTLLILVAIAGITGEGMKFGSKDLQGKCAANEASIAAAETRAAFQSIELSLLESQHERLDDRLRSLPESDPAVRALSKEIKSGERDIARRKAELSEQRRSEIPKLNKDVTAVCADARFLDGLTNLWSGIYSVVLTIFLFYFGLLLSNAMTYPRKTDQAGPDGSETSEA